MLRESTTKAKALMAAFTQKSIVHNNASCLGLNVIRGSKCLSWLALPPTHSLPFWFCVCFLSASLRMQNTLFRSWSAGRLGFDRVLWFYKPENVWGGLRAHVWPYLQIFSGISLQRLSLVTLIFPFDLSMHNAWAGSSWLRAPDRQIRHVVRQLLPGTLRL